MKKKKREIHNRSDPREERFYLVTDEELSIDGEINKQQNYEVYGNILLTENERKCLELGPKYMTTPTLEREDFEVEVEIESVKTRLELKEREEAMDEEGDVDEETLE